MAPKWISDLKIPEREGRPQRMQGLTDDQTIRGMFLTSTVEIVRREVGQADADAVVGAMRLEDPSFAALRKYPIRQFMELQLDAAERLAKHANNSLEEGVARTAAASVEIFFESVAGRTMRLVSSKNPHRLLGAAPSSYGLVITAENWQRQYDKVSDRAGVFAFKGDRLGPCHHAGVFEAAIFVACDTRCTIGVKQTSAMDFALEVSW
jgi:uncharacterized protein (TIGR02265 family)